MPVPEPVAAAADAPGHQVISRAHRMGATGTVHVETLAMKVAPHPGGGARVCVCLCVRMRACVRARVRVHLFVRACVGMCVLRKGVSGWCCVGGGGGEQGAQGGGAVHNAARTCRDMFLRCRAALLVARRLGISCFAGTGQAASTRTR